ncbi:MAG: ACT domain-containing protein [Syntrophobacterales bacterium]|nr:MAG: ACT domain-containing protein [Syntrophobacterales bacterium]
MIAYHISVFAENRPGRLDHITGVLAQASVNIRAIKISDLGEHGVVKILVDDPDTAYHALKQAGVLASQKEIVAVAVEDRPGGLHEVLKLLTRQRINVEDSYGFVLHTRAVLVIEVADVAETMRLLKEAGLHLLSREEIYTL